MPEVARGDSRVFGLASLLHLVEGEALTGRLVVAGGVVTLHLGHPVDARFRDLSGVRALLELFVRSGDGFRIETEEVAPGRSLGDIGALALEGCRLQDEWARIAGRVLAPAPGHALPAALAPLVPLLDGRRPVAVALELARLPRAAAIDPLLDALEAGHLVPVEGAPAPAPDAPAGAGGYESALEAARRLVRDGRLAEARERFELALAARPDDRIALQNLRRLAALQGAA